LQERQLFQGLIMAGGVFLLVKGIYVHCLWIVNTLVYKGFYASDWLTPSLFIMMGIVLLVGSGAITRFAYSDDYGQLSLSSIMHMGLKLLGGWIVYLGLISLVSLFEYLRMSRLVPGLTQSLTISFWISEIVISIAALAVGLVLIRCQPRVAINRGGV